MEREPVIPNPGELTGQGQNAYPNNMPDGSGNGPEINPVPGQSITGDEHLDQNRRVAQDQDSPEAVRNAAREILSSEEEARVQARMFQIVQQLRQEGQSEFGADEMQTIRMIAEAQTDSSSLSGNSPRPNERRPRAGTRESLRNQAQGERVSRNSTLISPDQFSDPAIKEIAQRVKIATEKNLFIHDAVLLASIENEVRDILETSQGNIQNEARELAQGLRAISDSVKEEIRSSDLETRGTFNFYLTKEDFEELEADPMSWLKGQMNKIYSFSAEGQEQSSPLVQGAQQLHERALSWLSRTEIGRSDPQLLNRFSEEFTNRLYTMFARSAVQQKNMEGIGGISGTLGTHGIMNTLSFEEGLVNRMHNRINEIYDDTRLMLPNKHMTPVEHSKIQSRVIREYADLIMASDDRNLYEEIGLDIDLIKNKVMSGSRMDEVARENIRRAVRTAYDHFVASQREAVIVARGEALPTSKNLQGILADPSALFQMFNLEQLLIEKFGIFNKEQQHFFQAIKRRYAESVLSKKKGIDLDKWAEDRIKIDPRIAHHAEEHHVSLKVAALEDYGAELMRDILQVNDWYSSGWKLDEFMRQIDENMLYRIAKAKGVSHVSKLSPEDRAEALSRAGEFGLFMRLRVIQNGSRYNLPKGSNMSKEDYQNGERKKIWKQISRYKPEDVVRMFREHGAADGSELSKVNQAFAEAGITLTDEDKANGITTLYDKFKLDYGGALRVIREMGFSTRTYKDGKWIDDWNKMPEQIDFSQIMTRPEYARILNNMLKDKNPNAAQTIATLYGKLQSFAGDEKTIKTLMSDPRFNFVNLRTFSVDDGLLDRMEEENLPMGLTALSKKLSPEAGGDAFKRTFNDATAAAEAHKQLLAFISAESSEEKLKAAHATASAVKGYRDPGVAAQAFRYTYGSYMLMGAITEKGRGPLSTLYETLDWKKLPGNRPINELQKIYGPLAPAFNNDDLWQFLNHYKTDLVGGHDQAHWDEMMRLARTRTRDRNKLRAYRGIIFGMLYILFEAYSVTTTTVKEGLKSEDFK